MDRPVHELRQPQPDPIDEAQGAMTAPSSDLRRLRERAAVWVEDEFRPIGRHLFRVRGSGRQNAPLNRPDEVNAERLITASAILTSALEEYNNPVPVEVFKTDGLHGDEIFTLRVGLMLTRATPYLWTDAIRGTVESLKLPPHKVTKSLLPYPGMWWTAQSDLEVVADHAADSQVRDLVGIGSLVFDGGDHLGEIRILQADPLTDAAPKFVLMWGAWTPWDTEADDDPNYGVVGRGLSFLNSPYIPKVAMNNPRGTRRQNERAGAAVLNDDVTCVILRNPISRPHEETGEHRSVEWSHRWIVSGHIRNQPYPSEGVTRPIYIPPHVKGPADKPLLDRVYAVKR